MKAWQRNLRPVTLMLVVCCGMAVGAWGDATVTVSPGNLSFGVPTGSTTSAPEAVTISVGGSGSVTVTGITITPNMETVNGISNSVTTPSGDFTETDTCGNNPVGSNSIAAPGSCAISVTFKASTAAGSGILESATLSFSTSATDGPLNIALTGAAGAIRLFDPVNVANSNPNATFSNLITFDSTTLNLSCPVGPSATLSSTPDGSGNVVVDNYLTLSVNGTPFGLASPAGNVCTGGVSDPNPDCFTTTYESAAGGLGADGDDPDNFATTWGVAPINVSSGFTSEIATTPTATVSELDAGVVYTGTTLFLVTSCSLTNANTGTETGNAVNTQPNQTLSFDTVVDHLDLYGFSYSFVGSGGTNTNSTPIVTNTAISPQNYATSVALTPFAGTACIPLASLSSPTDMCALKTQVCTLPGVTTELGSNCLQSSTPDILFTTTFDPSPDTIVANLSPAFGFLEFNDQGTCPLEGLSATLPCPQNGLVSFTGPGEIRSGAGKPSSNSTYIVVGGVKPPTTTVVVTPFFSTGPSSGWTNGSPQATFTGVPGATTPTIAPINFIEYGVNATSQGLPPTFPIPFPGNSTFPTADSVLPNTTMPCPATYPPPPALNFTPMSVPLPGSFTDGSSNLLHYSTTDCAATHELQFTFNGVSWSTSFKSLTLMADTMPPVITITTPASSPAYSANQKVKANYSCPDSESGPATCAGPVANGSYIDTTPTAGLSTPKSFTVNSVDNVGNVATPVTVNYSVSCNYAAVTLNPVSVSAKKLPTLIGVTASEVDCMSAPQSVKVRFTLSGPLGKSCTPGSTVMFTTPTFTIKSGTSSSITFPFPILRGACTGAYTLTTTTLQNGVSIDSVISPFSITP
jgi:hypothetical protein